MNLDLSGGAEGLLSDSPPFLMPSPSLSRSGAQSNRFLFQGCKPVCREKQNILIKCQSNWKCIQIKIRFFFS